MPLHGTGDVSYTLNSDRAARGAGEGLLGQLCRSAASEPTA